jgi:hypothetical protein
MAFDELLRFFPIGLCRFDIAHPRMNLTACDVDLCTLAR